MCELFALSASAPVDVKVSLVELARRGGETGIHRDGWGVAFADGQDFRVFKEADAAAASPWVTCLATHPIRSATVLAHIRHATRGARSAENTQPFVRELGGTIRAFAHNGDLGGGFKTSKWTRFHPIGDTDSEAAFCALLNRLPDAVLTFDHFKSFAKQAAGLGPANLIYAEPGRLLVHADRRTQADGSIAPPGLWMLSSHCGVPNESHPICLQSQCDTAFVQFASVPLSYERWVALDRGSVLEIVEGAIVATDTVGASTSAELTAG